MTKSLSRRNFLVGAGALVGATALAGCSPKSSAGSGSGEATSGVDIEWDGEYDVIVAGAGFAGLAAAVTIGSEGNGATCLLLEKGERAGGNSPVCGGGATYIDKSQLEMGKEHIWSLCEKSTPRDISDAYCEEIAENPDWVVSLFSEDAISKGTSPFGEYPEIAGWEALYTFNGANTHLWQLFFDKIDEYEAVTYMNSTPIEDLVQDPASNTVIGVKAGGKCYKANKGVIMCTGGYEANNQMIYESLGIWGLKTLGGELNTGDGQKICMKAGADSWHWTGANGVWTAPRNLDNTMFVSRSFWYCPKQWGITVGVGGRRYFMDYDGCAPIFPYAEPYSNLATNISPRHGQQQFGGEYKPLPLPETSWFIFDQAALDEGAFLADVTSDPVGDRWAHRADTIAELAELIEVPADELERTVATWNQFCADGFDAAFYRPAETLTPVAQGPFYAMLCVPCLLNTFGGPRQNAKCEVVDPMDNPIPHLYVAGEISSVFGMFYQGAGNVAECLGRGRTAARNALLN